MADIFGTAAVGFLVTIIYYCWRQNRKTYRLPPGPKQNLIFGNLMELIHSTFIQGEPAFVKFSQWAFQTGPICYLRFFRQRVVVISDARVAQRLCVHQADKFTERPPGLFLARVLKNKGIVFNDGPSWKEHRTFLTHEFRKYGFGKQSMEQRIQYVVDEYLHQIGKTNGENHDPHPNIATAVYNIIWTIISGDKFKWGDPFLQKVIKNLETNLQAVELTGPHNYVIILTLWHLIWHNCVRLWLIVSTRMVYFKQLIGKFRKYREETSSSEVEESMMYDYLVKMQELKSSGTSTHFTETQLLWLVSDLFIAGGETTITTIRWILLCLAKYPQGQERVRQEIINAFGRDSTPTYAQRTQLPYTEAFINEVLRLGGVAPGMWRNTSQDATYENYDIPKDTWVLLHFWAMSNNKDQWDEVKEFQPERFLNDEGMFCKNENLLAFSTGRRECPGQGLAQMELFLFTVGILQKFKVALPAGEDVDIRSGHFGVTYTPPLHHLEFIPV
ncbi:cytochrome P450 2U1-like isoform X2 [Daphnia pulicaria]|uniref:cytochrome P450 2U1-like isoform X2 n=1 Tax=Daphnia pulicaria TaxID=35523 RepID=UPI001EEB82E4|nr:cytochrome P450 2U1-like isoform X2 [Daphnia pulicaria]